jgi:hypothetical protein
VKKPIGSVFLVFVFLTVLLSGCAPALTPVPPTLTPIPPTDTSLPPPATDMPVPPTATATPKYALKCNITTQEFGFDVTGETGTVTQTSNNEATNYEYDSSGQTSGITINVNRDLVFENNQHKYHIEGTIKLNPITNELTYDITATGDAFGNSPQNCKSGAAEQSQPLENLPTPTTNPALNALPSGLREAAAFCGGQPPCSLLSAEKVKTLTDFDKQVIRPKDGELYCLVVSFSNGQSKSQARTPYGYYDGTSWLVMFDWTEEKFVEHGCTNFPK